MTEILLHNRHNGTDATAGHVKLFSLKHSWIPNVCVAPENNWNALRKFPCLYCMKCSAVTQWYVFGVFDHYVHKQAHNS